MERVLSFGEIISEGFSRGLKNLLAIIVNAILWALTIWIPYINVGTTLGLMFGIVVKMKNGESISMTEVFDPVYRKKMGEMFLVLSFVAAGSMIGYAFLAIPGIVIELSWSQAGFLVLEKDLNPIEAIKTSNNVTYGEKWTMFGGLFVLALIFSVVTGILLLLGTIGMILTIIVMLIEIPVLVGAMSYIYGKLSAK